ncbi:unnamed protein product [Calicophoron daubneyi]|uniref:Transmembrane protein 106A n=1 Tax=Calicophoron daubneyi TaxID=300641 RepID=A0AAV2T7Y8_CALDB
MNTKSLVKGLWLVDLRPEQSNCEVNADEVQNMVRLFLRVITMTGYSSLGSTTCPTCKGVGKIPNDSASEYIALIPLSDRRLRPPRTCVKITGAVLLCLVTLILLMVFLFPRSIRLSSTEPDILPIQAKVNVDAGTVDLLLENVVNITNYNFVPISIQKVVITPRYRSVVLQETVALPHAHISLRSTKSVNITAHLHFTNEPYEVAELCIMDRPYFNSIYVNFIFQVTAIVLWQPIEATLNTMQLVNCHPTINNTRTVSVINHFIQ